LNGSKYFLNGSEYFCTARLLAGDCWCSSCTAQSRCRYS